LNCPIVIYSLREKDGSKFVYPKHEIVKLEDGLIKINPDDEEILDQYANDEQTEYTYSVYL